jgi:hypothetical protein
VVSSNGERGQRPLDERAALADASPDALEMR